MARQAIVERFWKSIRYETVYSCAYEAISAAHSKIGLNIGFYNGRRLHSSLNGLMPDPLYFDHLFAVHRAA